MSTITLPKPQLQEAVEDLFVSVEAAAHCDYDCLHITNTLTYLLVIINRNFNHAQITDIVTGNTLDCRTSPSVGCTYMFVTSVIIVYAKLSLFHSKLQLR